MTALETLVHDLGYTSATTPRWEPEARGWTLILQRRARGRAADPVRGAG